jgi:epoxyqueuosine reductase
MHPEELAVFIKNTITQEVNNTMGVTQYRPPLVRWVRADDPRFAELHMHVHPDLLLPDDMLPGAKSVVAFFLPFDSSISKSNAKDPCAVSHEWAYAYVETNTLLKHITDTLIHALREMGIQAQADPPTHNFNPVTLRSSWSHKSAAVIAGLGSFGLHQMVITDAGCAGRFSSLVMNAALPELEQDNKIRCLYYANESCNICAQRCPVGALKVNNPLDKQRCYQRCLKNGEDFKYIGLADVCGKCATGPCSIRNPVNA